MKLTNLTMISLAMAFGAGCSTDDTTTDGGSTAPVEATFTSLYGNYFSNCKDCHSPTGAGRSCGPRAIPPARSPSHTRSTRYRPGSPPRA